MTLKHCQPRQIEASTAVEKTCKHTKHFFFLNKSVQNTNTDETKIIIISSTVGDKSATTNQHCNFPFATLNAFNSGPLLIPRKGSRINAAIFKINHFLLSILFNFLPWQNSFIQILWSGSDF
jgi:hypothetical protein